MVTECIQTLKTALENTLIKFETVIPLCVSNQDTFPVYCENLNQSEEFITQKFELETLTNSQWSLELVDLMGNGMFILCLTKGNK